MNVNPLKIVLRIVLVIARAVANQTKKNSAKFFANTRVRMMCMAYARHAEQIMLSAIVFAGLGLMAYLLLVARNSEMGEIEIILKSSAVFFGLALPAVPAIIILDKLELYKLQLKNASQEIQEVK